MSRIENLYRELDDFTVDIPQWDIADQGITVLWGPSGSGKTTVLRTLIGLEPCPGMRWVFQGRDIAALPVPERQLGVVFQTYELFPHMTARQNILFAAKARQLSRPERQSRLESLMQKLHLEVCIDRQAAVLSGGERQRVALARALIGTPAFLLCDEPFAALDQAAKKDARLLVRDVIKEQNIPTLLVTHDENDLEVLADHVVTIENGRLVVCPSSIDG